MSIKKGETILPGIILSIIITFPAWFLGKTFPIVGAPIFGILLGMVIAVWKRPALFETGIKFTSKKILQGSIILLGFDMNLYNVVQAGGQSISVMILTITAAFITAWFVGKRLNIFGNTAILIGVGTAICGGSAIAATAPIINADDKEVAYSISTIFLFNIVAVFAFPFIGHLVSMSDTGFGIWAGTAINDTSSVVAAGYSYSNEAGGLATIVKLTRTLMIIPITLVLAIYQSKKNTNSTKFNFTKVFPWFVLGFVIASIFRTSNLIDVQICKIIAYLGKLMIITSMAAVGLNVNFKKLISYGFKPMLLGLSCWFSVAATSLIVQHLLKLW